MEPLIHFAVPFFVLTLFGLEWRKTLPLSLLALLPDLDALFLVHRSFTHSIIVVSIVAVVVLLLLQAFKPQFTKYGLMGLFSVTTHLVLDVFTGFTPIFWPLYGYSIWVKLDLTVHVGGTPSLALNAYLLTEPAEFQHLTSLDAPLLTGEGLILSMVLLIPLLAKTLKPSFRR